MADGSAGSFPLTCFFSKEKTITFTIIKKQKTDYERSI
jgi:hypothetical protein